MDNCKKYHELIIRLISSGLDAKDNELLNTHVKECKDCSDFLLVHRNIERSQENIPMPNLDEFRTVRQNILRRIRLTESSKIDSLFEQIKDYLPELNLLMV